jgi:CBS domain-containing membrane protein
MSEEHKTGRPRREDYQRALESMDTFMDVGVDDLMTLSHRAEHFARRRIAERLTAYQIMSHPVRVVHPETHMSEAAHLMVNERISGLPVVDDGDRLLGIITEADFLRGLGVPAHHPSHNLWLTLESLFNHLKYHAEMEAPNDPVAEHMVREVVCASPSQDIHEVLGLMKNHKVKRLLVCDGERHVLGVVTRSDLVRIFFDQYSKDEAHKRY